MAGAKKVHLILLYLFISNSVAAQSVIKGTVTNAKTGEPLSGTNVYLANTTVGTSTDSTGYYKLELSFPGVYNLVFSFVGYGKKIVPLEIPPSSTFTIDTELKPKAIQLDELSVTGSNELWKKRLAIFKNEFIGTSDFAEKTTIVNPEVLRFEINQEKDLILASTVKPIIVINNALGYKIYLELEQFKWSLHDPRGFYLIYPKFEPMVPKNNDQQEVWGSYCPTHTNR